MTFKLLKQHKVNLFFLLFILLYNVQFILLSIHIHYDTHTDVLKYNIVPRPRLLNGGREWLIT